MKKVVRGVKVAKERWRGYEWAGVPAGATNASWDLFLACGQAILGSLGGRRLLLRLRPASGDSLLDQLRSGRLAPQKPPAAGSSSAAIASEGRREDGAMAEPAKRTRGFDDRPDVLLRRAVRLLTERTTETFPFLRGPLGEGIPAPAALLTATLCARYVVEGEGSPLGELRSTLGLLAPLPHEWEGLGKSLAAYCRRRGALLKLQVASWMVSASDGSVVLSPEGYRRLLGIVPPKEYLDEEGRLHRRPRSEVQRLVNLSRPRLGLADLVLPPDLHGEIELAAQLCRRRRQYAPVMLFHGAPGTGKTHAAQAFAGELGKKLASSSLAQLHDKYVGETEKHLEKLFREAAASEAVLLLDEADALLLHRSFAQRTYEISWVNTLLKLLEKPGVPVILCTNFATKLDPAVHRRLHQMIEFPLPEEEERRSIWERELRLARIKADVDMGRLARLPLSGGLIANAVHQAAARRSLLGRRFALTTETLVQLAQKELPKMGGGESRRWIGFRSEIKRPSGPEGGKGWEEPEGEDGLLQEDAMA